MPEHYVMQDPVTHIAGSFVMVDERYLRQRCAWCGHTLIDVDKVDTQMNVPAGKTFAEVHGTWDVGSLVEADEVVQRLQQTLDGSVPANSCMRTHKPTPLILVEGS